MVCVCVHMIAENESVGDSEEKIPIVVKWLMMVFGDIGRFSSYKGVDEVVPWPSKNPMPFFYTWKRLCSSTSNIHWSIT